MTDTATRGRWFAVVGRRQQISVMARVRPRLRGFYVTDGVLGEAMLWNPR